MSTLSLAEVAPELYEAQAMIDEAQAALPSYEVSVIRRQKHKDTETDEYGTYYQDTARYSDGAVRLVTIGIPHESQHGKDGISAIPMVEGDALCTGPDGLNREIMRGYMNLGLPVIWPHHQGRHSVLPTSRERLQTMWHFLSNKSVGRSAHQDLALLDNLGKTAGMQTKRIIHGGFSRSSMKGEAVISLADQYDTVVEYSDSQATCFAHEADRAELRDVGKKQIPREGRAGLRLLGRLAWNDIKTGNFGHIPGLAGTLDGHPLNLLHELAWIRPLVNGDAGIYAKAIPLGHVGVRTVLSGDLMSHQADQETIHENHPEMEIIVLHEKDGVIIPKQGAEDIGRDLMHLDGADPRVLQLRLDRLARLMTRMHEKGMNEFSLLGLTKKDVLPIGWPLQAAA